MQIPNVTIENIDGKRFTVVENQHVVRKPDGYLTIPKNDGVRSTAIIYHKDNKHD